MSYVVRHVSTHRLPGVCLLDIADCLREAGALIEQRDDFGVYRANLLAESIEIHRLGHLERAKQNFGLSFGVP